MILKLCSEPDAYSKVIDAVQPVITKVEIEDELEFDNNIEKLKIDLLSFFLNHLEKTKKNKEEELNLSRSSDGNDDSIKEEDQE